jgi:hypothetical protein
MKLTIRLARHTVEELQAFSNVRTPSPPWVHLVRLVIPMSVCDAAAEHLIAALGGPEVCARVVGGTKWWQVRGRRGCVLPRGGRHGLADARAGSTRSGSRRRRTGRRRSGATTRSARARRRRRRRRRARRSRTWRRARTARTWTRCAASSTATAVHTLLTFGVKYGLTGICSGGYYFGSVDQERCAAV